MSATSPSRATPADWLAGARPRTLPAAVAPVLVGSGAAHLLGGFDLLTAVLCAVVALALQVGVNYANDYSDGIRGTDDSRVGPRRLVGSGLVSPTVVRAAAFGALGLGALAGLAVVARSGAWWLLAIGVLLVVAAWTYTGGRRPYGYLGFGEVVVFLCFGLAAVLGTTFVQAGRVSAESGIGAVAIGLLAAALLVANNLRDIPTDAETGKRTLAVRLGDHRTRLLYAGLVSLALALVIPIAWRHPWAWLTLGCVPFTWPPVKAVLDGASGRALIAVLGATGRLELLYAVLLTAGLALS